MKSQRGVTLISLTIYIIVMTIVIGIVSLISTYFYENTHSVLNDIDPITEYTRFSSIFTEEVNHNNIKILAWDNHYVVFSNGVQYTYIPENKGIYRSEEKTHIKVSRGVENCTFERKIKNGKEVIAVIVKMENTAEKKIEYTLKI